MATTLKILARKCEVSLGTASQALKDDVRVAEKTRIKIQTMAKKMRYVPSNLGRALQSRRSCLVGYLLVDVGHSFFGEILQGMGEAAAAADYGLLVAIGDGRPETEERLLRQFLEKAVEGVIVSNCHPASVAHLRKMNESGTPVVVCSSKSPDGRFPRVANDMRKGFRMALEHLAGLGHRRIALYSNATDIEDLWDWFTAGCRINGLPAPRRARTRDEMARIMVGKLRPTGALAIPDASAIELMDVVHRLGLRVPADLSVIGYHDTWVAAMPEIGLTSLVPCKSEMGREAMSMLLHRIQGKRIRSRLLPPRLAIRTSTAAPS